jgi:hypothetical protein
LEDALQLAAQLNDQQILSALNNIKLQAEAQGMDIEHLIAHLPGKASPAMLHLQERLGEQVQLSALGTDNPQAFRLQVHGRTQNHHAPKDSPTSEQPGSNPELATPTPASKKGEENGKHNPTHVPGQGNQDNNQGGNGNHGPKDTQKP